jgi:hypothetical protein
LGESTAFCAQGCADLVLPGLTAPGLGDIGVPVSVKDAEALIKHSEPAPYGRGEETLYDPSVRRVWQINPANFELRNPAWSACLARIVDAVRAKLGVMEKVRAHLYKLLVYQAGSFFAPHRDSEKVAGMFATLIVCLPSAHRGGTLIVMHEDRRECIDFDDPAARYQLQYAAFYADCLHEITPVASGYRICLVYNLVIHNARQPPRAPAESRTVDAVAAALADVFADGSLDKIAVPLMHQYTIAGFGEQALGEAPYFGEDFDEGVDDDDDDDEVEDAYRDSDDDGNFEDESEGHGDDAVHAEKLVPGAEAGASLTAVRLKGRDWVWFDTLARAAEKAGCQAYLALITHWESGAVDYDSLDYVPGWSRRGRSFGDRSLAAANPNAQLVEVSDERLDLTHWFNADGSLSSIKSIVLDESEIVSDIARDKREYRTEIHEATGNEGVSMERWYRQAAIVIWPRNRYTRIMANEGPRVAVPALEALLTATASSQDRASAHELVREIVARSLENAAGIRNMWRPERPPRREDEPSLAGRMLSALAAIDDATLAMAFVHEILPSVVTGSEGEALIALIERHDWKAFADALHAVISASASAEHQCPLSVPARLFETLCCHAPERTSDRTAVCRALAPAIEAAIDRFERIAQTLPAWHASRSSTERDGTIVAPVLRGLITIGAEQAIERFAARVLADEARYAVREVLIPAVRTLQGDISSRSHPVFTHLREHCRRALQEYTRRKPDPPKDWAREATLVCKCADCRELATFLRDPCQYEHRFRRRLDLRVHLEENIVRHRCDVSTRTEKGTSPHVLVCTKNDASFRRKQVRYEADVALLKELENM